MRIIAGTAKGTRLGRVPAGVRPVSDRAREGLFSSLGDRVPGARVLDLYAGTGAMGIEALSRGAASATLVDRDPASVRTIRANLERTGLAVAAQVVRSDAAGFLRREAPSEGFDLCFLDPPYAVSGAEVETILAGLGAGWLSAEGWTVALTRPATNPNIVIPVNWRAARRLEYGDSLVALYQEVSWA